MSGDQAHHRISRYQIGHHRHRWTAVRGQERTDDHGKVRLDQRQQCGVRDVAGSDDQQPGAWAPGR